MARGAREIGVAEGVAGAVDAGTLAVPDAEDAVIAALAADLRLLRAPEGGGREILVEAGLEDDVRRAQRDFGALELLVEPAERRAAIAGNVAGGGKSRLPVPRRLHQGQPDDRLGAGKKDVGHADVVFVAKRDGPQSHRNSSSGTA